MEGARIVRAPRGPQLSCRGWQQEGALRMLCNNLDPEVAERPDDLVVYGGTGRAARDWAAFDRIVATLRRLGDDETLLVQSGKPVGVFRTHSFAPRVLLANSLLVPEWASWDQFRELEAAGLTMYGQMTAGSWIYIGTQGILQGTYETFAAVAQANGWDSLRGRVVLTGGLGGMGGAQPLAVTMNEGVALCVEVDPERLARRLDTAYLDERADDLDRVERAAAEGRAVSVGLVGNAADVFGELLAAGFRPDVVTDQTSAHDPLGGYVPSGIEPGDAPAGRGRGVRLRQQPARRGPGGRVRGRLRLPGVRARLHPAAVLRGQGAVPLGRPVRRPGRHRPHRPGRAGAVRRRRAPAPLAGHGRRAGPLPGAAGPDLLARLRRTPPGRAGLQRPGGPGRGPGPDRDRPRPPGLRIGGQPLPGDRGHGRRQRRHRRLADPQRPAQHRLGGLLGE